MAKDSKPIRRVVSVEFWRDDKVLDSFSPEDKLFMLYLLTNPKSTQLGVYNINKKTMAYELGYSVETVSVLLDRFERSYGMIRYSQETHEIAIKNYLRHSILSGGKPVEDLLRKEIKAVTNKELLDYAFQSALSDEHLNSSVRTVITEYYESCRESSDESSTNRTTNGTPSIINNHISNNVVVDIYSTRGRAREGTNNNNDEMSVAFTDDEAMPLNTLSLEVYAANNIVNMNGRNMEFLNGFRDKLNDDLIRYAIDLANKCCKSGVPTYSYVEKILMAYVRKKITTVEQAQALEKSHEAERNERTTRPQARQTVAQESDDYWSQIPFVR